ncbi:hypothetical protein B0H10DRAFT_2202104 [Mycena sp. CBHHK59/15]|nr:hypothetical protein B0H10DRAFT_2202104 [Mycena sp. CBHHK59/15]
MSNFVKFVRQKIADNLLQLPNFVRTGTSLTWSGPPFLADLGSKPSSGSDKNGGPDHVRLVPVRTKFGSWRRENVESARKSPSISQREILGIFSFIGAGKLPVLEGYGMLGKIQFGQKLGHLRKIGSDKNRPFGGGRDLASKGIIRGPRKYPDVHALSIYTIVPGPFRIPPAELTVAAFGRNVQLAAVEPEE